MVTSTFILEPHPPPLAIFSDFFEGIDVTLPVSIPLASHRYLKIPTEASQSFVSEDSLHSHSSSSNPYLTDSNANFPFSILKGRLTITHLIFNRISTTSPEEMIGNNETQNPSDGFQQPQFSQFYDS
jgi:hypothetical protein